jgi:hypothetical protein
MARLLDEIGRENCGANWDPQNHFSYNGESFRPGYEALGRPRDPRAREGRAG